MPPAPRRQTVPLERLTFDRRCQQRERLFDPDKVAEYAALAVESALFPKDALLAVYEKGTNTFWVYDGFDRGEALRRAGRETVAVEVIDGTLQDAIYLSLSANAANGRRRSDADVRKAVAALLDNDEYRIRALREARDEGGVTRGLAKACGVSKGVISDALRVRGLRATRDGRLERVKPAPPSTPSLIPPPPVPGPPPAPAKGRKGRKGPIDEPDGDHEDDGEDDGDDAEGLADFTPEPLTPIAERPRFEFLAQILDEAARLWAGLCDGPAGHFLIRRRPVLPATANQVRAATPSRLCECYPHSAGCKKCGGVGFFPSDPEEGRSRRSG